MAVTLVMEVEIHSDDIEAFLTNIDRFDDHTGRHNSFRIAVIDGEQTIEDVVAMLERTGLRVALTMKGDTWVKPQ